MLKDMQDPLHTPATTVGEPPLLAGLTALGAA